MIPCNINGLACVDRSRGRWLNRLDWLRSEHTQLHHLFVVRLDAIETMVVILVDIVDRLIHDTLLELLMLDV